MILKWLFQKRIRLLRLIDEDGTKFVEVQVWKPFKRDWYFLTYTNNIAEAYDWLNNKFKNYNIYDII